MTVAMKVGMSAGTVGFGSSHARASRKPAARSRSSVTPGPADRRPSRRSSRPSRDSQRCGDRADALASALVLGDLVLLLERDADVVEPVQEPVLDLGVDLERELVGGLRAEVDARAAALRDRAALLGRELDGEQPVLRRVAAEDVGEARRDDRLEAVVGERPGGVLAARARAEVAAGDENWVLRQLEAVLSPLLEQKLAVARALDALEVARRDDLIGVDVVARQVGDAAFDDCYGLHAQLQSRMST